MIMFLENQIYNLFIYHLKIMISLACAKKKWDDRGNTPLLYKPENDRKRRT
jgi:hypothetical protein